MSISQNTTREDLIAVGYVIYSSLYKKDERPLTNAEFAANCERAFEEFSNSEE